jgi:hypothetical protein
MMLQISNEVTVYLRNLASDHNRPTQFVSFPVNPEVAEAWTPRMVHGRILSYGTYLRFGPVVYEVVSKREIQYPRGVGRRYEVTAQAIEFSRAIPGVENAVNIPVVYNASGAMVIALKSDDEARDDDRDDNHVSRETWSISWPEGTL